MSGWTTGIMMAIGLAVAPVTAASQPNEAEPIKGEATIVLHVVNVAALPRHILNQARDRVAEVYEGIGVRTVWVDSKQAVGRHVDGGLHLTVMLLPRGATEWKISAKGIPNDALGLAHAALGRAYIFCDRVAAMQFLSRNTTSMVNHDLLGSRLLALQLGAVIAHEVGHLMLPEKSHSRSGVMRAQMNTQHANHLQSFDTTQADIIRTTLMKLTVGATGR